MRPVLTLCLALLHLGGCGSGFALPQDSEREPTPGLTESQGSQGQGQASPILSWGYFSGFWAPHIVTSGGPLQIQSFERVSEGVYEITYDILTDDVGVVAAVATGGGFEVSEDHPVQDIAGANAVNIVSARQLLERTFLTIQVVNVLSVLEPESLDRLDDADTYFSLIVFGETEASGTFPP